MALSSGRRRDRGGLDAWPGYVDALSTLLMVLIFVLLVFVLAQGFLSVALSTRDRALDRLNRQVAELSELLSLERGQSEELRAALGRTSDELRAAATARDAALRNLTGLREERDRFATEREALRGERDRLAARVADLELADRGGTDRIAQLETRLAEALARAEAAGGDAAQTVRNLTETRRLLAAETSALEQARRDLAATASRLDAERSTREATQRDLATRTAELAQSRQALAAATQQVEQQTRLLATERGAREATARDLAQQRRDAEALAAELAAARATLDQARRDIAALREEAARLDRQVVTDRATIEARLSDLARLSEQIRALSALRDQLERQAEQALARAGEEERRRAAAEAAAAAELQRRTAAELLAGEAQGRATAAEERRQRAEAQAGEHARLSESARAQVALLNRQIEALRSELARVAAALNAAEDAGRDKDAQIAALGQRLNLALAARVEELQGYRSDFFGRLRRVLGDRPEVRIVGDRFVFQSEVLFPVGSAELTPTGERQLRDLGRVLLEIARQIPGDLGWVLRVDGHADRTPIRSPRFASNWELSSARAIAVAQLLIQEGLPPNRVAATAFGDTQPLAEGDTPEVLARNRRIELRLTDR